MPVTSAKQVPNQLSLEVIVKLSRTVVLLVLIFYITANELPYSDSYDIHSYFRKYYSIEEMPDVTPLSNDYLYMDEVGGITSLKNYLMNYYAKELFNFRYYDSAAEYTEYVLEHVNDTTTASWTDFSLSNQLLVGFTSITPFRMLLNYNKAAEMFEGGFVAGKTSELRTDEYLGMEYNATLGGYPVYIDVLGSSKAQFREKITEYFDIDDMFGQYLETIKMSQGFYHPTYELIIYFEINNNYDLEGNCRNSLFVSFFKSSVSSSVVLVSFFLAIYGWIFVGDMIKLYQSIKNARVSSSRKALVEKGFFYYLCWPFRCFLSWLRVWSFKIILGFKSFYFHDILQTIDLIMAIFIFYGIYLVFHYNSYIGKIQDTYENVTELSELGSNGVGPDALYLISDVATTVEDIMLYNSLVTLLLGFKTLATVMMMFPKTNEFFKKVLSAIMKILPFFLLYGNIQVAFCVFFYFYYGRDLDEFETFTDSFISTLGILFGNSTAAIKMSLVDFPIALISVSAYFIVAIYIYSNMFFVYLKNESNLDKFGEPDSKQEEGTIKNYQKFVLFSIADDFKEAYQRLRAFLLVKVLRKPPQDGDIEKRTKEIELDEFSSKNFDVNYSDKFLLSSKKFIKDSEMEVQMKRVEKRGFVLSLWDLFFNIFNIILLIAANLLILDVNNSFENYQYFESIIVQTTSTEVAFEDLENIEQSIIHAFNVTSFLCDGGANVTEVGNQSPFKNQVVFAFNRVDFYNSLETSFLYNVFPYTSKQTETSTAFFQFYEYKTSFSNDLAYEDEPAYSITFNCSDDTVSDIIMETLYEFLTNDDFYISYIDLIMFIEDTDQELIIRGDIIYERKTTGDLTPTFDAVIMNLDIFDMTNAGNICRTICQAIVLAYTLLLLKVLVKSVFMKYRNYKMWFALKIDPLPEMVKRHRWWKMPEALRMLVSIISLGEILTLCVILLLIAYFIEFILLYISYDSALSHINNKDSTYLVATDIDDYFSNLRACILLSVITIFFNTLKTLQIIGTFDQFKVIIRAFWLVATQIWPLLLLLIGTIFSFTLWLYLSPNFYYYDPFDIVYNLVIFIQDLEGEYVIPDRNKVYFLLVFYLPFFIGIKFIIFNLLLVMNLTSYRRALEQVKAERSLARPSFKEFWEISRGFLTYKQFNPDFLSDFQDLINFNLQLPMFLTNMKDTIRQCELSTVNTPKKWASILGSFILNDWKKMKTVQQRVKRVLTSITKNTYTSKKRVGTFIEKMVPSGDKMEFDKKFLEIHEYFWEFHHLVNEQIDSQEIKSRNISKAIEDTGKDKQEAELDEEIERLEAEVGATGRAHFLQKAFRRSRGEINDDSEIEKKSESHKDRSPRSEGSPMHSEQSEIMPNKIQLDFNRGGRFSKVTNDLMRNETDITHEKEPEKEEETKNEEN